MAMNSATFFAGNDGFTTITNGPVVGARTRLSRRKLWACWMKVGLVALLVETKKSVAVGRRLLRPIDWVAESCQRRFVLDDDSLAQTRRQPAAFMIAPPHRCRRRARTEPPA
jgi:hypothetical protein